MPTRIAIAVVQNNGRFLVGQRGDDVALAGFAEFPGGKVQSSESIGSAAVRECLEETGLETRAGELIEVVTHDYDHATVELYFVSCRLVLAEESEPNAPFRWIDRSGLRSLEFPAANAGVVDRLSTAAGCNGRAGSD